MIRQAPTRDLSSKTLALQHGEVHVWLADLNHSRFADRDIGCILSQEERERAARFYFQRDRDQFTAGRAMPRSILGRYLNMNPRRPWSLRELDVAPSFAAALAVKSR